MVKNGGGRVCHSNLRVGMFPRVLWAAVCAFFCIMGLNEIRNAFHDPQYHGCSAVRLSAACRGIIRVRPM